MILPSRCRHLAVDKRGAAWAADNTGTFGASGSALGHMQGSPNPAGLGKADTTATAGPGASSSVPGQQVKSGGCRGRPMPQAKRVDRARLQAPVAAGKQIQVRRLGWGRLDPLKLKAHEPAQVRRWKIALRGVASGYALCGLRNDRWA